jgi:hypothetical protein
MRLRPPRVLAQDSTGATGAFLRPDPLLLNDLDANLVVAITGASRSKPSRGDIERFGLPTQDAVRLAPISALSETPLTSCRRCGASHHNAAKAGLIGSQCHDSLFSGIWMSNTRPHVSHRRAIRPEYCSIRRIGYEDCTPQ